MSSSQFRVAFEGAAFDDGEMDVRDLAPALLALGEVIRSANRALNGDRAEASLKMRAANNGSFEALLSVDVSFLTAIGNLLDSIADNPDRTVAAQTLMEMIIGGTVLAGASYAGLLQVLKMLKGKAPDSVETRLDGSAVIIHNHNTVVLDPRTLVLLDDVPTRLAVEKFSEAALRISGVDAVKLEEGSGESDAPGSAVRLVKEDIPALVVPPPAAVEPTVEVTEREVFLKIVTLAFRGGYVWRFSDGGEKPFTAEVEDTAFLNEVTAGKLSLSANDRGAGTFLRRDRNSEEEGVGLTKVVPFLVEDMLTANGGAYRKGGDWTSFVVTDGKLVTGQNPASSEEAARELLKLL